MLARDCTGDKSAQPLLALAGFSRYSSIPGTRYLPGISYGTSVEDNSQITVIYERSAAVVAVCGDTVNSLLRVLLCGNCQLQHREVFNTLLPRAKSRRVTAPLVLTLNCYTQYTSVSSMVEL